MVAPGVFNMVRAREEGRVRQATHDLSLAPIGADASFTCRNDKKHRRITLLITTLQTLILT